MADPLRVVAKGFGRRYVRAMTAIAEQLDEKLKTLDAKAASSLAAEGGVPERGVAGGRDRGRILMS